ncbi:MAG TPA: bifunctional alpha,alpha-trehalose-phosphate synthase (UDP-forming)/trehalose-phosphatase [Polyangiaceae bacterium]|nr:bifunctional alpha,alpha-trehalose-phosphate synthase (UDP-forming)/trehalose-phosphatase [Polyangiaceae bacterium]
MPRLIIVSNRLPFTLHEGEAELECKPSSGGLITAFGAYVEQRREQEPGFESIWVGWPGSEISDAARERASELLKQRGALPVFLSREESDDFYYGFCNRTLWPLFHYFSSYVDYEPKYWDTYVRVNQSFCGVVSSLLQPGDTVWVQDYQLLLLPALLRERHPGLQLGFFLHTPFPSYEVFRLLPTPWKREILRGMLGADLIGFHVHEYTQYFLHSVQRILGLEHRLGQIAIGAELRRADTFPLGVDFAKFEQLAASDRVRQRRAQIAEELGQRKIVLSVDRLDYTKGIESRLRGYELFLERFPEWHDKVVFVPLVVPSRAEVPEYEQLKRALDERVGEINGRFGTLGWVPVVYQYRAVDQEELVALYVAADAGLITPLRDGMNLVAKEYLASKSDGSGALILSEMAGASREMAEAILINPNHWDEIAEALNQALSMSAEEQRLRNTPIRERLRAYDSRRWAVHFMSSLGKVKEQQRRLGSKLLNRELRGALSRAYRAAQRPLLLLDYDGTLVPIAPEPRLAAPDQELTELLRRLASRSARSVFIISGRERGTLERWLGPTRVGLIAEHGAWLRESGEDWRLSKPQSPEWKAQIVPIMGAYVSQVAGSLLEEKDQSVAWHYRRSDPELGAQRAKELADELTQFTANLDLQVLEGKKVIEVRVAGVNKGAAAAVLVLEREPDFVLAIGDDQTDEDLFRSLPASAYSVHVGAPFTVARFNLHEQKDVRPLLSELLEEERT